MTNSFKVGAVSGLSAGFVKALAAIFIGVPLAFKLGLPYYWIPPPPTTYTSVGEIPQIPLRLASVLLVWIVQFVPL